MGLHLRSEAAQHLGVLVSYRSVSVREGERLRASKWDVMGAMK